jgi:hypothetical protein
MPKEKKSSSTNSEVYKLLTFNLTGDYLELTGKFKNAIKYLNTDLGSIHLYLENQHNYSIFSFEYIPSKLAKNNGMTQKTYTTKVKFGKLPKKSRKEIRFFLNNVPKYININTNSSSSNRTSSSTSSSSNNVYTQPTFYTSALTSLSYRMSQNLLFNSIKNLYTNINLISPNYSSSSSSNSYTNWTWTPGEIAGVTVGAITTAFVATMGVFAYYYGLYLAPKAWWADSKVKAALSEGISEGEAEAASRASELSQWRADSIYADELPNPPILDDDEVVELTEDRLVREASPHEGITKFGPLRP